MRQTRSKFGNVPTVVDGQRFDSKLEAARYQLLKLRERAGEITGLQCQEPFILTAGPGVVVGKYKADFSYFDNIKRERIVEDCKGGKATQTPLFNWKRKHLRAEHKIEITIVEKANG